MVRRHPRLWIGLILPVAAATTLLLGCSGGTANAAPAPPPNAPSPQKAPVAGKGAAAPTKPAAPVAPAALITTFPGLSVDGLPDAARDAFIRITNEEICPCDCPRSFASCLAADSACGPARLLAEWMIQGLAEGADPANVATVIAEEIADFNGVAHTLDVKEYTGKGAKAPRYTVVEYADFECGHCRLASTLMNQLVEKRGTTTRVVFKHFPLTFHPTAKLAAAAVEAAGAQGKFWEMHDAVFATQDFLDEDVIVGHGKALGLDVVRFERDRTSKALIDRVQRSRDEGERIGIEATPSFFVNGRRFRLPPTVEGFDLRFRMEDARANARCQ